MSDNQNDQRAGQISAAGQINAADRVAAKSRELLARALITQTALLEDDEGLPLFIEMVRESARAVEFWLKQLDKAVTK